MSETITASLTVSGGDTITVNLNTAARGPAGTGGGGTTFVALTDASTADLPTINTPLSSALAGKAPSSGIAPSAIAGTAVITTDPRLSDARTPTAHTHVVSDITPVSGQHLIGRHAGGNGAAQEVTVGNGLEFQGSGIRRSALTGDVTAAAGSNSTAIANDAVSNAKLANMEAATIKGRAAGGGTGDPQDLTASEARTALGSGATGDLLFQALTPAAARETALNEILKYDPNAAATRTNPATQADDDTLFGSNLTAGLWEIHFHFSFNVGSGGVIPNILFGTPSSVDLANGSIPGNYQVINQAIQYLAFNSTTGVMPLQARASISNVNYTGQFTVNLIGATSLSMTFARSTDVAGSTIIRRAGAFLRARKING